MSTRSEVLIDEERVRVTRWTFEGDGDGTGWHVHEYDYVVVPVTGGTFTVTDPDGSTRRLEQQAGTPYAGRAGTEHDVVNSGGPATFIDFELKGPSR